MPISDIWDSVKYPWEIRKIHVWKKSSCIYECDGDIVAEYTVVMMVKKIMQKETGKIIVKR